MDSPVRSSASSQTSPGRCTPRLIVTTVYLRQACLTAACGGTAEVPTPRCMKGGQEAHRAGAVSHTQGEESVV